MNFRTPFLTLPLVAIPALAGIPSYTPHIIPFEGYANSDALSIVTTQIAGDLYPAGTFTGPAHAAIWNNPTQSPIDLHPGGIYTYSSAHSTDGQYQAGDAGVSTGGSHAMLWAGSADSFVDLNPPGYFMTGVSSVAAGQEVGIATPSNAGPYHAALWTGDASTFVDLNPPNYGLSTASATDGTHQVGDASPNNPAIRTQAILWTNTPQSAIDLTPSNYPEAHALGIGGHQQVGYGLDSSPTDSYRALLWYGTAESYVDLTPPGTDAFAYATNGTYQVGSTAGGSYAAFWAGSADSYINLHALLPSNYVSSNAVAIDSAGNIVGYAQDEMDNRVAVLWTVPEPTASLLTAIVACSFIYTTRGRRGCTHSGHTRP